CRGTPPRTRDKSQDGGSLEQAHGHGDGVSGRGISGVCTTPSQTRIKQGICPNGTLPNPENGRVENGRYCCPVYRDGKAHPGCLRTAAVHTPWKIGPRT